MESMFLHMCEIPPMYSGTCLKVFIQFAGNAAKYSSGGSCVVFMLHFELFPLPVFVAGCIYTRAGTCCIGVL